MRLNPGAAGRQGWNNASWNFSLGKPQLPKLFVNHARKGGSGARRAVKSRVGRDIKSCVGKFQSDITTVPELRFKSSIFQASDRSKRSSRSIAALRSIRFG